jgi:hypothetical protein
MAWNIQKPARGAPRGAPPGVNEDTSIEEVDPADEKKQRKRQKRATKSLGSRVTVEAKKRAPRCPPFDDETPAIVRLRKRLDETAYSLQRPYEWLRLIGPDGKRKDLVRFQGYVRDRIPAVEKAKRALAEARGIKLATLEARYAKHNGEVLDENRRVLKATEKAVGKAVPAKVPKTPRKKRQKKVEPKEKKKKEKKKKEKPGNVAIDWIEVRGPIFSSEIDATQRVFVSRPQGGVTKEQAARTILTRFAPRAFRRPVGNDEIARYLALFENASERGDSFEDAVGLALTGILVSPHFLFRVEHGPTGRTEFELDDFQLASRLSYFLWLSMPDEELFRLARENRLHESKVLDAQVRRMIASPNFHAFAKSFVGQWLGTSALGRSISPDTKKFRSFTPGLRDAMLDEPVLVFESLVRENRSLLELLDSRRTFVNEELARHYGLDGVVGDAMRSVELQDENRGGILAMAGPLAVTSLPLRTSPVIRGKWILETLLGHELPPPPPDAGDLPEEATKPGGKMTLREAYGRHRREPRCASCHERLDPLGFSLENFDAIGRWREKRDRKPIDASGVLPDGERFEGVAGLRTVLLARKDEFIRHLATRMLGFSLGRRLRYYDEPTIRQLTGALQKDRHRPFALIRAIVSSEPFRKQRPPAVDEKER